MSESIQNPNSFRHELIARVIDPYGELADTIFDQGNPELAGLFGQQQIRAAARVAADYDAGVYAPDSAERMFPVRDGVFPFMLTDPAYTTHEHWREKVLPIQIGCSALGKRVVDTTRSRPDLSERAISRYTGEEVETLMLVELDGKMEPLFQITLDDANRATRDGNSRLFSVQFDLDLPFFEMRTVRILGRSATLHYRRFRNPEAPQNGWTISESQLSDDGSVHHRIQSRDMHPKDIAYMHDALENVLENL